MRRRKSSLAVALVAAGAATVLAQNPPPRDARGTNDRKGTAVIRGRVVTADRDATPLARAHVTALGGPSAEALTDGSGRFSIAELPAGRYSLSATKAGYAAVSFGRANVTDIGIGVDVADGDVIDGIDIRMPRGAAIVGRIVDEAGEPVVGAPISVGTLSAAGARTSVLRVEPRSPAETDDRGEYRIGSLLPGRYYVSVNGASQGTTIQGAPPEWARTIGWSRTFYPGVPSLSASTPVQLVAGEERTGIDLTVAQTRPAKLALSLADASGAPIEGLINLFLPDENGNPIVNRGVPLSPRNPKMIQTLEPGEWVAVAMSGGKALAHIKLSSGDDTSLTLTTGPGARISGRVVFDGTSARPTRVSVGVAGAGLDVNATRTVMRDVNADGSFEMTGVVGTIDIVALARPWVVRSVKYGDHDLMDQPLTVSSTDDIRNVQIVLSDRVGDLNGVVTDADGRPAVGCTVVAFPDATGPSMLRWSHLDRADTRGRFAFSDLLPGAYLTVAASNIDASTWLGTDSLDRLRATATRVTIDEREKKTITMTCGTMP